MKVCILKWLIDHEPAVTLVTLVVAVLAVLW